MTEENSFDFDQQIDALRAQLKRAEDDGDDDLVTELKLQIDFLHHQKRQVVDRRTADPEVVGPERFVEKTAPLPGTDFGIPPDHNRGMEDQEVIRRFHLALSASQFRRAEALASNADLSAEQRREMSVEVERARRTWKFVKSDEVEEFLAMRDWQEGRQLVDVMAEHLGVDYKTEATKWRVRIDVEEARDWIGRIRTALDLDRPVEKRPDTLGGWIQGLIHELRSGLEGEHLAPFKAEIDTLFQSFQTENARRSARLSTRRTLVQEGKWRKLLQDVHVCLDRGDVEYLLPNNDDSGVDTNYPIDLAIKEIQRKLAEIDDRGIRNRVDEATAHYQTSRPDLERARQLVDEARASFTQNASDHVIRSLETCEEELRALENERKRCDLQLQSINRIPNIKSIRAVIKEVGDKDPGHPLLSAAIRQVVSRFSVSIKDRIGLAKEQATQQGLTSLDDLENDVAELLKLLSSNDYEPSDTGNGHTLDAQLEVDKLTELIQQVRADLENAGRRARDLEQVRARLEAWISSGREDTSEGSSLVEFLQGDPAESSRRLIAKATPLLDSRWKEQNAAIRIAERDVSGAELLIRELFNDGAGRRIVVPLERKVQRLKIFLETGEAIRERTLASLERAEATSLKLGPVDENSPFTKAELDALHSELRLLRQGAVTTRQAIAEARTHLAASRFADARASLGGPRPQLLDLGDELRLLGDEIASKWQAAIVSGLEKACRTSNVNRIYTLLDEFTTTFDRAVLDHELAQSCFAVLAREWEEERGTVDVEVLALAVKSARAVAFSQDERDRREHGSGVLALRRDIPAIRRALDWRDAAGAMSLLNAIETQTVSRSVLAPFWVEVGLLEQDLERASGWLGDVADQRLKSILESRVRVTRRMLTNIRDLEGTILSRVTNACADATLQLADPSISDHLGALRDKWEQALRTFEQKCLREIDEARQETPLKDRLAPYERLQAAGMLTASKQVELSRLKRELVRPVDALLRRVVTLLRSVSPDQMSVKLLVAEVDTLLGLLADRSDDPDYSALRNRLERTKGELLSLGELLESLGQAKAEFEELSQRQLDSLGVRRCERIVENIPSRFKGNPGHKDFQVIMDEMATIQREWAADEARVNAIKLAWDRGEYWECERRAGEAANHVLRRDDRFGLKETVAVTQGLSVVRGASAIRTMCSKKLALLNDWKNLVGELERDCPRADDLVRLEQGLTNDRYRGYRTLRERFETHESKCQDLLTRCARTPSDAEDLLTSGEVEPFTRSIQRVRLVLQQHIESVKDFLNHLARDAEEVEDLRPEVERLRRDMEENQEGPFWNRRPRREAQENYERALARLRKLRPDG